MPDLTFNKRKRAVFPTKHHGNVSISQIKWEEVCLEPERKYFKENAEKIATTLINPDVVRYSRKYEDQFIYYKRFETIKIGDREIDLKVKFWAVVIDKQTGRICTVYPTQKPKAGHEYKGG
ncbi:hypothetical protein KJ766_02465 [Patescibacteria group bacterium]|nr:hypothetical protein [Patescibacteria group bacterium]